MTNRTYPWSFVTQILCNGQLSHGGDSKTFEVMTSNLTNKKPWFSSLMLAAFLYQGYHDRNHKLWNIGSTETYIIYTPYAGAAGISLHINGKFAMGKLKSSFLK